MQIPVLSICAMAVSAIVAGIAPLVVFIVLAVKKKLKVIPFLVGILIFIPCLVIAVVTSQIASIYISNAAVLLAVLSLRAGLVEETGRLIAFRFLLKKYDRPADGLAYGIGHGWCEAFLLLGINYIFYIIFSIMINTGSFGAITAALPASAAESYKQLAVVLATTGSGSFLLAGLERISAMMFHIGASMLVFYAVRTRKYGYYALAILLHTALNSLTILMAVGLVSGFTLELMLLAVAGSILVFGVKTALRLKPREAPPLSPESDDEA